MGCGGSKAVESAGVPSPGARKVDVDEAHTAHAGSSGPLFRSCKSVANWQQAMGNPDAGTLFGEYQELLEKANAKYASDVPKLKETDALIVVDMQNDFVPKDEINADGGAFGVAEGALAANAIVNLINQAAECGAFIVATRDYHPDDHCSFAGPKNGPFPPHCVQGTKGAHFYPPIETALRVAREKKKERVEIVFKGFHNQTDSFGGVTYGDKYFNERGLGHDLKTKPDALCQGCAAVSWTGSFCLKCSNLDNDLNAPPDVMAVFDRRPLADRLKEAGVQRLFVVGLALDFCVLDTALNAAGVKVCSEVFLVVDAARAAHIPGIGAHGTGFLSDPADIVKKTSAQGVKLLKTTAMV